eukprot:3222566-Amphidinium_carterae.1
MVSALCAANARTIPVSLHAGLTIVSQQDLLEDVWCSWTGVEVSKLVTYIFKVLDSACITFDVQQWPDKLLSESILNVWKSITSPGRGSVR